MKTLKSFEPLNLCTGNASNGRIFKSWRIYNREGGKLRTVATLNSDAMSPEMEHRLALLLAAAPDLLAALQGLKAFGGDGGTDADDACRAAIAKATKGGAQ